jgi:uncharacterized membrane protein YphA (DoxX/SURF4 family)
MTTARARQQAPKRTHQGKDHAMATTRVAAIPAADPADRRQSLLTRAELLGAEWAPTAGRILLSPVLAWFGYHELVQPAVWTGYVPMIASTSSIAVIGVLAHGWLLLVLAVALVAGVNTRLSAAIAAILLLQIVITLTITGGLSDLTMRDIGVLGLAVCLTGRARQRLTI